MYWIPLDIPPASGLAGIANNDHGHAVMSNIQLLIYSGESGDSSNDDSDDENEIEMAATVHPGLSPWGMISGTPAAWFAQLIDTPSQSAKQIACEFGGSKVYVRQADLLGEQRDWLYE